MDHQDFSKFSKGMDSLERFFPETWPRAILVLAIPAAWAVWACYNHLVLIFALFTLMITGAAESRLLHGLIIRRQEDTGPVLGTATSLSDDLRTLEKKSAAVEDLRTKLARLSEIVEVCGLEDFAVLLKVANNPNSENVYHDYYVSGSPYGPLGNTLESVREVIQGLSKQADGGERETSRLMDAVNRIDPPALRDFGEIVSDPPMPERGESLTDWYDRLNRHRADYEPSVKRLEDEIAKLKQEIQALKGTRSA